MINLYLWNNGHRNLIPVTLKLFKTATLICWLLLLIPQVFAQLDDFNFSVSTVDETCSGNGSISMSVSGTTAGATITYILYLYPDTGTPIAQTSTSSFNNLTSGTYLVVARQTLGTLQNTESANAIITDTTTTLDFEVSQAFMGNCDTADLIVTVLSGNAVSYEILSGPVTAPPQASNIFNDVPQGTYVVRAYDACNNALSKTYTILLNANTFSLGGISLPTILDSCDAVTITNTLVADDDGVLAYPITIDYTITPPDGSPPISFSQTYNSGPESELDASELIDMYGDQVFNVQLIATDLCGNVKLSNNEVDPNPEVRLLTYQGFCGLNLDLQVRHFLPPYTIEFTQAPADFNPIAFNEDFPGPFTESNTSFEQADAAVPYGEYTVIVTDACGRTGTFTLEVEEEPIEPEVLAENGGCDPLLGTLMVTIPNRDIATAIFTMVPAAYNGTAPIDVSNNISIGVLTVIDLPQGDYTVDLIDECGTSYTVAFTIPSFTGNPLSVVSTPNCVTETGTLRIASPNGPLQSVIITDAPATFPQTLPYDYSSNILAIGIFYVGNLPEGIYEVSFTDSCGTGSIIQTISAYQSDPSIYNLQRNCGSFDLGILDLDRTVYDQTYWFQKYFPASNTWGHPYTSASYTEGTMPNTTNAIEIENEDTLYNIFLTGSFRLIKAFQPFNNPNPGQRCYDIFAEFEVSSDLIINGVYNLNCEGGSGPSDIVVDVVGVPPYNFSIVSPVVSDNGTNNIFTNLSPGTYEIKVEDVCGSIENIIINLEDILPVVNNFTPTDLVLCSDVGSSQAIFDLSQQNAQVLGGQDPDQFTVTYHLNQNDADTGANPLPEGYQNSSSPQTIYVRVIQNTLNICYQTTTFQLIVGNYPELGPDETTRICDGTFTTLSAAPGYSNYVWSTGDTTPSIAVNTSGDYTVTASQNYSDFLCEDSKTFTVNVSGVATIDSITVEDFTPDSNSISIIVSGSGDYEYSLDGTHYQPTSYFDNLLGGEYTIYVRDRFGCGVVTEEVYLLNYMKFFTPNGDTINEFWQIKGARYEPDLEISIYDRFGKLLTSFNGTDRGWDGLYNGQNMPSNDYWFVITRGNGKRYKGHFTLKRWI